MQIEKEQIQSWIQIAMDMRDFSYAPYSSFTVGAALVAGDQLFTGCNVENAAFAPGICAERTAIAKAVSEGVKSFDAIVIAAGSKGQAVSQYTSPCGVCRQMLREFVNPREFRIIMARSTDDYIERTLEELLPMSFGPENIG